MRNNKGITLIALVITIIVLLILAGVSIAMLTGTNGLLTKATAADLDTKVAEAKEKAAMEIAAQYADYLDQKYTQSATGDFTTTASSEADVYSIGTDNTITITPKTSAGKTVSGTVATNGKITWSET